MSSPDLLNLLPNGQSDSDQEDSLPPTSSSSFSSSSSSSSSANIFSKSSTFLSSTVASAVASATVATTQYVLAPTATILARDLLPEFLKLGYTYFKKNTPQRGRDIMRIFSTGIKNLAHIIGETKEGGEFIDKNKFAFNAFIDALASPLGRQVIVDSASSYLKVFEALSTPESKSALDQNIITLCRIVDFLASDTSKQFYHAFGDALWEGVALISDGASSMALAEVIANICHALEMEADVYRKRARRTMPKRVRSNNRRVRSRYVKLGDSTRTMVDGEPLETAILKAFGDGNLHSTMKSTNYYVGGNADKKSSNTNVNVNVNISGAMRQGENDISLHTPKKEGTTSLPTTNFSSDPTSTPSTIPDFNCGVRNALMEVTCNDETLASSSSSSSSVYIASSFLPPPPQMPHPEGDDSSIDADNRYYPTPRKGSAGGNHVKKRIYNTKPAAKGGGVSGNNNLSSASIGSSDGLYSTTTASTNSNQTTSNNSSMVVDVEDTDFVSSNPKIDIELIGNYLASRKKNLEKQGRAIRKRDLRSTKKFQDSSSNNTSSPSQGDANPKPTFLDHFLACMHEKVKPNVEDNIGVSWYEMAAAAAGAGNEKGQASINNGASTAGMIGVDVVEGATMEQAGNDGAKPSSLLEEVMKKYAVYIGIGLMITSMISFIWLMLGCYGFYVLFLKSAVVISPEPVTVVIKYMNDSGMVFSYGGQTIATEL